MKPKNFTVGQTAYLLEAQQSRFKGTDRIRKVNVLKVGRVYVTIDDYGRGRRFGCWVVETHISTRYPLPQWQQSYSLHTMAPSMR